MVHGLWATMDMMVGKRLLICTKIFEQEERSWLQLVRMLQDVAPLHNGQQFWSKTQDTNKKLFLAS